MSADRITGKKADLLWTGQKPPSIRDLKLRPKAAKSYQALLESAATNGSNCQGRFAEFAGRDEDLPTDQEARLLCVGCQSWSQCGTFKIEANPTFGVWQGEVRGRDIGDAS